MRDLIILLIMGVLTDNLVAARCVGLGDGGVLSSDTLRRSVLTGGLVAAAALASTAVAYPLYHLVLSPLGGGYLLTLLLVLCCAGAVWGLSFIPGLRGTLGADGYAVILSTALAVCCLALSARTYIFSLFASFTYSLGLLVFSCIFFCARLSLRHSRVPKALRGLPIDLLIAAIIALVFYGAKGII